MRILVAVVFSVLFFSNSSFADKPAPAASDVASNLKLVDCLGHKGLSTVCLKNASSSTIVSARCGKYDVPLNTRNKTIPPGATAASVDLGNSTRTCRNEGITATTDDGLVLKGQLNAASVDDATEVWFRNPKGE